MIDKVIGIGKASYLAKAGDYVQVKVTGKHYMAKAIQSLGGLDVLLIKSNNRYYVYPAKPTTVNQSTKTVLSFAHVEPKPKKNPITIVYGMVIKVKRQETITFSCSCPTWTYNGYECVEVCNGSGLYTSLQQCRNAHPPEEDSLHPNTQEHSVGYFYRGFLDAVGAPEFDLGFFYPTMSNPSGNRELTAEERQRHPYCNCGKEPFNVGVRAMLPANLRNDPILDRPDIPVMTGYTIPPEEYGSGSFEDQLKRQSLLFTSRQWVLPSFPNQYDVYVSQTEMYSRLYYITDPRFYFNSNVVQTTDTIRWNSSLWEKWEQLYKTVFTRPPRPFIIPSTFGKKVVLPAIPYALARIPADEGYLYFNERLDNFGNPILVPTGGGFFDLEYNVFGIPNWLWKEVQIHAIAVNNVIYGNNVPLDSNLPTMVPAFKQMATSNYKFYRRRDINYILNNAPKQLPPAAIITKSVSLTEEVPYPPLPPVKNRAQDPSGGSWTLLWDTRTCPLDIYDPVPDPKPNYTYDVYDYYLITNITTPIHLLTARSDDLTKIYLTATESEVYGTILYGSRKTSESESVKWCKLKTFISDGTFEEFNHEIPEDTEPFFPDDWQAFRNTSFDREDDESENPCFNSFSDEEYGAVLPEFIRIDEDAVNIYRIDPIAKIPIVDEEGDTSEKPWAQVILDQSVTIPLQIFSYQEGYSGELGKPVCLITEVDNIDITLDQIPEESEVYIAPLNKEEISIQCMSVFYSAS